MNYREVVKNGYNNCSDTYSNARKGSRCLEIKELKKLLKQKAKILDIGCGSGIPILLEFKNEYEIYGVDISKRQLEKAKENFKEGKFFNNDIMDIEFAPSSFDAIISFYTLFHIKRELHEKLFIKMSKWLKISGYLLCTVSINDDEEYTESDFFGVEMYWSNFGLDTYLGFCNKNGFKILKSEIIGHGFNSSYTKEEEKHPYILAQKVRET